MYFFILRQLLFISFYAFVSGGNDLEFGGFFSQLAMKYH